MAIQDPIQRAQEDLLNAGLINLVILDSDARIEAVQGALVVGWQVGESAIDRLFVLAGMEGLITAMAEQGATMEPLELPAVFLGGNHEDGDLGVSVRMSALEGSRVLLLLRPLEAAGAVGQRSVQQHNDLALVRGQMEKSQSQAELNITARKALFDNLRWGFRAPLSTLAQAVEDQAELAALADAALHAVDDWLELLILRTKRSEEDHGAPEPIAVASMMSAFQGVETSASEASINAAKGRVLGSAAILCKGISAVLRAANGPLKLAFTVENASACWTISGIENTVALEADYRLELARSAMMLMAGSLRVSVSDGQVVFSVPVQPLL